MVMGITTHHFVQHNAAVLRPNIINDIRVPCSGVDEQSGDGCCGGCCQTKKGPPCGDRGVVANLGRHLDLRSSMTVQPDEGIGGLRDERKRESYEEEARRRHFSVAWCGFPG